MRLDRPRIPPVPAADLTDRQRELLAALGWRDGSVPNIFGTLVRVPDAYEGFMAWGGYVLSRDNPLPRRERELVVLRVGFLCAAGYEWAQHAVIGERCGLSPEEIERIKSGADAPGWSEADAALLRAADELVRDHFVTDATWRALRDSFTEEQCMAVVFTAGQYTQVSMMLNTFGVQLDDGLTLDEDLRR